MNIKIFTNNNIDDLEKEIQKWLTKNNVEKIYSDFKYTSSESNYSYIRYIYFLEYKIIDEKLKVEENSNLERKISVEIYNQLKDIREGLLCIDDLKNKPLN